MIAPDAAPRSVEGDAEEEAGALEGMVWATPQYSRAEVDTAGQTLVWADNAGYEEATQWQWQDWER